MSTTFEELSRCPRPLHMHNLYNVWYVQLKALQYRVPMTQRRGEVQPTQATLQTRQRQHTDDVELSDATNGWKHGTWKYTTGPYVGLQNKHSQMTEECLYNIVQQFKHENLTTAYLRFLISGSYPLSGSCLSVLLLCWPELSSITVHSSSYNSESPEYNNWGLFLL